MNMLFNIRKKLWYSSSLASMINPCTTFTLHGVFMRIIHLIAHFISPYIILEDDSILAREDALGIVC